MVLQQNSDVAIWGWSDPAETVRIVAGWNSKDTIKVKADNTSAWETTLKTIGAGGPYSIQILGSSRLELKNVMLGEVWICSGQSNMEMSVNWKLINGEEEAAKANNPNIRIFPRSKNRGKTIRSKTVTPPGPSALRKQCVNTSATGYFFARELQQKLNVPVGIIVSAWGGTPAEVWIEKSHIENDPVLNKSKVYRKTLHGGPVLPEPCIIR